MKEIQTLSIYFFSLCFSIFFSLSLYTSSQEKITTREKISHVFGMQGLNVGVTSLRSINSLYAKIQKSSPLVHKKSQQYAAHILQQSPYAKEFKHEIKYLNGDSQKQSLLFTTKDKNLGSAIINYIKTVHKKIKSAETKLIEKFLKQLQKNPLPAILDIWKPSNISYHHKSKIKAQSAMLDMGIMMGTQFGVEAANQWVEDQDSVLFNVLSQASSNIQSDFSVFQNKMQNFSQESLSNTIKDLSSAKLTIEEKQKAEIAELSTEVAYLSKMTSLDIKRGDFLVQTTVFDSVVYDISFEKRKMFTPKGASWRNIYQKGDWKFDPLTKSFWQYNLVSFNKITDSDPLSYNSFTTLENYIFSEFFTHKKSYNIDCDITLYKVTYPFFSGVLFNNNRWVSGSASTSVRYRVVGIYGESADNIGVYYAETVKNKNALDSILDGSAQKLSTVTNKDKISSDTGLTYSFNITTEPQKVSIAFNESGEVPTQSTVTSKDPTMFIFHGAGFISPGAIAQYKLKEPSDLIFSDEAITEFIKEDDAVTGFQNDVNNFLINSKAAVT